MNQDFIKERYRYYQSQLEGVDFDKLEENQREIYHTIDYLFPFEGFKNILCMFYVLEKNRLAIKNRQTLQDKLEASENELNEYIDKNMDLKFENWQLKNKITELEATLEKLREHCGIDGNTLQTMHVKKGRKIAYKDEASSLEVAHLVKDGYTVTQIADMLNISRPTVYSRIKEAKKIGFLSD